MLKYYNSNTYVPGSTHIFCPECKGESIKNIGGCSSGCCSEYKCTDCEYEFTIEWPD